MRRDLQQYPRACADGLVEGLRREDTVDIWRFSLDDHADDAVARWRESLSPDEEARAQKFFFGRDRRRFVAGRGIVRALLALYLRCEPSRIEFRYGPNGKPSLAYPCELALHFNLAHSDGLALVAFTRAGEVGIDVERIRDIADWQSIAQSCFSADEREKVMSAPAETRQQEFFQAWTRQEALLKATGAGLGYSQSATLGARAGLKLHTLAVGAEYVASLAVPASVHTATSFRWEGEQALGERTALKTDANLNFNDLARFDVELL